MDMNHPFKELFLILLFFLADRTEEYLYDYGFKGGAVRVSLFKCYYLGDRSLGAVENIKMWAESYDCVGDSVLEKIEEYEKAIKEEQEKEAEV